VYTSIYGSVINANFSRYNQIGEAYQVLSNEELRKRYDKYGKEESVPGGGFGELFSCDRAVEPY
jgi:DnaJ-class molecular chaperone